MAASKDSMSKLIKKLGGTKSIQVSEDGKISLNLNWNEKPEITNILSINGHKYNLNDPISVATMPAADRETYSKLIPNVVKSLVLSKNLDTPQETSETEERFRPSI